jgi:hypothetical protein
MLALAVAMLAVAGPSLAQAPSSSRPTVVRPDSDESLQWAAAVVRVDPLRRQGGLTAKLFGTAGGDPAMNGLYTHLAFFESAGDGWRVFRIGDFLSYRILAEAPGRVTLELSESVMDQGSGAIGSRVRRLALSWSPGAGGEPPALVRLTPAR